MMAAFDAPLSSESCPRRGTTTTPLQALAMMNGSLVQEESAGLPGGSRQRQERTAVPRSAVR